RPTPQKAAMLRPAAVAVERVAGDASLIDLLALLRIGRLRRRRRCSSEDGGEKNESGDRRHVGLAGAADRGQSSGPPSCSGYKGRRNRILAKRLPQHGPVHGLIAEDGGGNLRKLAIGEDWHRAEIRADGAFLELGRERQNVGLALQPLRRKRKGLRRFDGSAAKRPDRLGQRIDMLLVMILEADSQVENGLLQQSALGAELIGGHGLL